MKKFLAGAILSFALVGPGCTAFQRQGTVDDLGAYVGATPHPDGSIHKDAAGNPIFDGQPDYDPTEVATKAGEIALNKVGTGDWTGLGTWGAGGLGILLLGLWKRRSVGQAVAKVLDLETKSKDA